MSPSAGESSLDPSCQCGHTAAEHDSLAARYCQATVTGHLTRDCMCAVAALPR
jgi:hypothetical protein